MNEQASAEILEWACDLLNDEQVSSPGFVGERLAVAVGVQRVMFDVDPDAIVDAAWTHEAFAKLRPSCDCLELDPWCVHAVAAVFSISRALDVDPGSLDLVFAAGANIDWMDAAFAAVSPVDRRRLLKALSFCLHPDRRQGDDRLYFELNDVWERWKATVPPGS